MNTNGEPRPPATMVFSPWRSGALPLGSGDGVAFYSHADDAGNVFDGRCDFVISGLTPVARYWTITLYDHNGRLVANAIRRNGFTSQEIVRSADGRFEIAYRGVPPIRFLVDADGYQQGELRWSGQTPIRIELLRADSTGTSRSGSSAATETVP